LLEPVRHLGEETVDRPRGVEREERRLPVVEPVRVK
jgi:hypothetical protein